MTSDRDFIKRLTNKLLGGDFAQLVPDMPNDRMLQNDGRRLKKHRAKRKARNKLAKASRRRNRR